MQTQAFLDWVAGTVLQPARGEADCAEWGFEIFHLPVAEWRPSKPRHGYKWAQSHPNGFEVMASPSAMGVHLIAPGHALKGGQVASNVAQGILMGLDAHGAKLTRLDLAVDAIHTGLHIDDLATQMEHAQALTEVRTWNYVTAPNGGQTLYIGARSSERFIRVYNKASELAAKAVKPEASDWKRIELEAKGMAARAFGKRICNGASVSVVANDSITAMIDFPGNREWRSIFANTGAALAHSHRTMHNTERWLLGTVAKSLARQLHLDPTFKSRFEAVVKAFLDELNSSRSS